MLSPYLRTDYKVVDKREGLGSLFGWLRGETRRLPVVCDRGRPFGILNERRALRPHLDPHHRVERLAVTGVLVGPEADVWEALAVCAEAWVPHLPVWDGERLLGYVRAVDLLGAVEVDLPAELVALPAEPIPPETTVAEAFHLFLQADAHVLPVVEAGRVRGVVSRGGLLPLATDPREGGRKGTGGEIPDPRSSPVEGYLDGRYEWVAPRAPFAEVVAVVRDFGFALVGQGGTLRGLATPESLADAATRWRTAGEGLRAMPRPGSRSEGLPT